MTRAAYYLHGDLQCRVLGIFLEGMCAVAYEATSQFDALLTIFAWEAEAKPPVNTES